jgi:hypothetical protein
VKPPTRRPLRYRLDPLPIEGATAREWDRPTLQLSDPASQGVLPFSDGGQLGPLFNTTTEKNHGPD